jgi:hypothetical protein
MQPAGAPAAETTPALRFEAIGVATRTVTAARVVRSNGKLNAAGRKTRAVRLAAATTLALLAAIDAASGQSTAPDPVLEGDAEIPFAAKIGRVHDNLRRAAARQSLSAEVAEIDSDYPAFKARMAKDARLTWSLDLSYLQQWGRPDGGSPAGQLLASPSLDWTLFDAPATGTGSVQIAYTLARYGTAQSAADVQSGLGLITPINDYPARQNVFAQLSYTHALPGNRWLLTVGQYPFSSFDGNLYLANQQQNFSNNVLAQNGSATYAQAGLGAYVQVNAAKTLQFAAGLQNAGNITGSTLSTRGLGEYGASWFGYAQWTPQFSGLGSAQYSIAYYQVPTVPAQPRSTGWSLNAAQNLNDSWALFGRANRAYGYTLPIRGSYALGAAINNPLGRSPTDQIGLAFGYSDAAPPPVNPAGARDEKVVEAYWNWTLARGLLLTPDVQYLRDPARAPTQAAAWALSLRLALLF